MEPSRHAVCYPQAAKFEIRTLNMPICSPFFIPFVASSYTYTTYLVVVPSEVIFLFARPLSASRTIGNALGTISIPRVVSEERTADIDAKCIDEIFRVSDTGILLSID